MTGDGKVLTEGVTDEAVVSENAAQVRMTTVEDTEEIEGLPLEPVRHGPEIDHGIHDGLHAVEVDAHPQATVVRDRQQMVDGGKTPGIIRGQAAAMIRAPAEAS